MDVYSSRNDSLTEMKVVKEDVRNCVALSLDKRIDEIIQLITEIEELLGLSTDREYREERVNQFRQQALLNRVDPHLDEQFSLEVDQYLMILREKRDILQRIFECCGEFCLAMKNELDTMNDTFKANPALRADFVTEYNKKKSIPISRTERQRRNRLPSSALSILWDFVRTHKNNPYPTNQQKEYLVRQTKLTMTQIRNWFTNTRKRKLNQTPDSDDDYSFGSEGDYYSLPSSTSDDTTTHHRRGRKKKLKSHESTLYSIPSSSSSSYPIKEESSLFNILDTTKKDNSLSVETAKKSNGTWVNYSTDPTSLLRSLSTSSEKNMNEETNTFHMTSQLNHDNLIDFNYTGNHFTDENHFPIVTQSNQHDMEFYINNDMTPPPYKKDESPNDVSSSLCYS